MGPGSRESFVASGLANLCELLKAQQGLEEE